MKRIESQQQDTDTLQLPDSWTVDSLENRSEVISTRMSYGELEGLKSATMDGVVVLGIKVSDMNLPGNETTLSRAILTKFLDQNTAVRRCAPPGTVVFPKRGAAIATNKKRLTTEFTAFDPNVIGVLPGDTLDKRFLFYWFQTFDLRRITEPGPTPQLNKKNLEPLQIPVPPLFEQREIADVLDAARIAITFEQRAKKLTEELKQAAMRELFSRGVRRSPRIETEIGTLPSSWTLQSLADVCTMQSGGTPPKSDSMLWIGDVPWVSGKDLKFPRLRDVSDHVSQMAADRYSKIAPAESVLVLVRGMGLLKGFPLSLIERPMAFNQDLKALIPKEGLSGSYLMHALTFAGPRMLRNVSDAAHGTKRLSQDDLDRFQIPIPPVDEQMEMVDILDAINRKIELHTAKRSVLDALFNAILHKLMTGQIRVSELDLSALQANATLQEALV